MQRIGTICGLQVQRESLKQGRPPHQFYDPAGIVAVHALRVDAAGVVGLTDDGEILDIHHAAHPQSKNRDGINGVSINVRANYARMRRRFGPHLTLGCAGENIIVADEGAPVDFARDAMLVRTRTGVMLPFTALMPAPPCAPFSRFALATESVAPAPLVKETLQFLSGGMRGFYATPAASANVISVGDEVFVP